jgi:hypothetical protein
LNQSKSRKIPASVRREEGIVTLAGAALSRKTGGAALN